MRTISSPQFYCYGLFCIVKRYVVPVDSKRVKRKSKPAKNADKDLLRFTHRVCVRAAVTNSEMHKETVRYAQKAVQK